MNFRLMPRCSSKVPPKEAGQAIVLVLFLTVIGVVSAIGLISTGVLTNEKMQLQNAADATAYSVSVLEARDLNYGAYMNRAMVANEVAIGQLVSMYSWAKMLESEPDYIKKIEIEIGKLAPPIGPAIAKGLSLVRSYISGMSKIVNIIVPPFSENVGQALAVIVQGFGESQKMVHLATLGFSSSAIAGLPKSNTTGRLVENARMSYFGQLALIAHYDSYYGDIAGLSNYQFVKHPDSSSEGADIQRYAQVVNDSRDGFTKNRKCSIDIPPMIDESVTVPLPPSSELGLGIEALGLECPKDNSANKDGEGGWDLTFAKIAPSFKTGINFLLGEATVEAGTQLNLSGYRKGGTQLEKAKDSNEYVWSAADAAELSGKLEDSYFEFCFKTFEVKVAGVVLFPSFTTCYKQGIPDFTLISRTLGAAAVDIDGSTPTLDPKPEKTLYGGIPGLSSTLWKEIEKDSNRTSVLKPYEFANFSIGGHQLAKGGYQMINDPMKDSLDPTGFEAPYLLIALELKNMPAFSDEVAPDGDFKLEEADLPLSAIAKSEVYYSQPLSGNERRGAPNGFNPYWAARLVDTTDSDRIMAINYQLAREEPNSSIANGLKDLAP